MILDLEIVTICEKILTAGYFFMQSCSFFHKTPHRKTIQSKVQKLQTKHFHFDQKYFCGISVPQFAVLVKQNQNLIFSGKTLTLKWIRGL